MSRKTLYALSADAQTQTTIALTPTIVDAKKSDLAFTCSASYIDKSGNTTIATIANPNGAIKVYRSMDDMLKDIVSAVPSTNTVQFSSSVIALQKPISLNTTPASLLLREKAVLVRSIARQNDVIAKADVAIAAIASYATGSAAQVAFYNEQTLRRTVATASKTAMDARLVAVNALL